MLIIDLKIRNFIFYYTKLVFDVPVPLSSLLPPMRKIPMYQLCTTCKVRYTRAL